MRRSGKRFVRLLTLRRLQPTKATPSPLGLVAITVPLLKNEPKRGRCIQYRGCRIVTRLCHHGKKGRRGLLSRLRLGKPKSRKGNKQKIWDRQRQQLEVELQNRGFNGDESEVNLLLSSGSLPSGRGLRLFYRDQRLQEDDKWREWC